MAGQGHSHIAHSSYQNGPVSPEQHRPFDNLDYQNHLFEHADFWTSQEGLFDAGVDISSTLHSPDSHLPASTRADIARGSLFTNDHSSSQMHGTLALDANGAAELHEGNPGSSPQFENIENIIPNHYGPGYWLSICSGAGLAWIRRRIGSDDFAEIAKDLEESWTKQLKLEHTETTARSAEPESQLAWQYCNAYFEHSVDSLFDAVYRPEFERHLRAHLSGKLEYYDSAWYALRNVVYAAGCRTSRCEDTAANFADMQREAWGYFQNSLSVHSELLLKKPSLRSVRALLAMTLFAESLASPALSSGLVSNAALLAQSLCLHRKAADAGSNVGSEALQRIWLFWGVYCCEKFVAQRSGRPSVIDDDDINCGIPKSVHAGSTIELEMFTYIIQTCQYYDQVSKQLLSTHALHEPPIKMLNLVTHFNSLLRLWKETLPPQLRPVDYLKQFHMPDTARLLGLMTTHCSYYDLLMLVHTIFAYPWVTESFSGKLDANLAVQVKAQIAASSLIVADAARSLIVIARNLDMGAGSQSFMLHFPMHAFVSLFVYVIENPEMPSVRSDLALLDVAAGHFGQMEFVTGSKLSFPFARDIVTIARKMVDEASTANLRDGPVENFCEPPFNGVPVIPRMNVQNLQVSEFDLDSWMD